MNPTDPLTELLVDQLSDLLSAENQLVLALPKLAAAAASQGLQDGFLDHLDQTKGHVARLAEALNLLGREAGGKTCQAMRGLVAEGEEAMAFDVPGPVRDTALIGAARRVEHYEMAAYKSTRALAGALDEESIADLLQQTLDEESDTDKELCTLAGTILEAALEGASVPSRDEKPSKTPKAKPTAPSAKKKGNRA